eukprot:m.45006 g.45006  ORF g.45006 m.45006 type:complete len:527 (+) comp6600_c0_seq1:125-1705(+)
MSPVPSPTVPELCRVNGETTRRDRNMLRSCKNRIRYTAMPVLMAVCLLPDQVIITCADDRIQPIRTTHTGPTVPQLPTYTRSLFGSPPAPPYQTAFQRDLVMRVNATAGQLAKVAVTQLLDMLDAPAFRTHLKSCCPTIAISPASELLDLLVEGVRCAELTHNFNANSTGTWEGDVNMTTAQQLSWLPNLWEVMYLKLAPPTEQRQEDLAEVNIMGFRPFSHGAVGHGVPQSLDEASSRPTYTTVDMLRVNVGNNAFGDVSLILRPQFAHPLGLLEPVDTGNWEDWCNTSNAPTQCVHYPFSINCSAWDRVQGTFDHPEHALLANIRMWDSNDCANETAGMLPRLFSLLFGEHPSDRALSRPSQMMSFIEANLAGTVLYPHGVKHVVATAQSLLGSPLGHVLRAWCVQQGWPLLWARGPSDDPAWWANGSAVLDTRVLDPHALSDLNVSFPATTMQRFDTLWMQVASARAAGKASSVAWYGSHGAWAQLPSELVVSSGLWPLACADTDACVGVLSSNDACVCRQTL